jgi:uncharacterized protein (TIGR03083 family)
MMMRLNRPDRHTLGSSEDGLAGSDPRLASMLNNLQPAGRRRGDRLYPRLGWQQAMLLPWVVISAGLLAVALVLNTSGHKARIQSTGTVRPSPVPQHASRRMNGPSAATGRGLRAAIGSRSRYASAMGVRRLVAQERGDLVALLRTLSDEEWEAPSLCAGWRVRDVVGHLLYDSVGLPSYLVVAARCRSADRINAHLVEKAKALSPSILVDKLASSIGRGPFATLLPSIALADVLVHQQDIRRPLGRERTVPADRLMAVLDRPDPFANPGRRSRGLRFEATDIAWSKGEGPEVRGTGEAIALAVAGRDVALDELEGDGVAVLRKRISQT